MILLGLGSLIDAKQKRLPDLVTLGLLLLGLLLSFIEGGGLQLGIHMLGAAVGFGAFWAIGEIYFRASGSEGLGLGDAKLLGAAGAWLGPILLAPVVFIGALLALLYVQVLRVCGQVITAKSTLAFGPFLSVGFAGCWAAHLAGWA